MSGDSLTPVHDCERNAQEPFGSLELLQGASLHGDPTTLRDKELLMSVTWTSSASSAIGDSSLALKK